MKTLTAISLLLLVCTAASEPAAAQEPSSGLLSIPSVREALEPGAEFLARAYGAPSTVLLQATAGSSIEEELREYLASLAAAIDDEGFARPDGGLNGILARELDDAALTAFGSPSCSFVLADRGFDTAAETTGRELSLAARRWALANARIVERNMRALIDGLLRVAQADPSASEEAVRAALGRQRGKLYGLREDVDRFLEKYRRLSANFAKTLYGDPASSATALGASVNPVLVATLDSAMPPPGTDRDRERRLKAAKTEIENSGIRLERTSSTGCNTEGPGILTSPGSAVGGGSPGLYLQLARAAYLYQAIWGDELAGHLDVDSRDLKAALGPVGELSRRLADRIVDFRVDFLRRLQVAPGQPLLEIREIAWEEDQADDHEVVISGPSELGWGSQADYQLLLLRDGEAVRWYPNVRWEVTPDTQAVLDEDLVRKRGVAARLTTGTPDSPMDETTVTLIARYEDNLGNPGEVRLVINVSNLKDECNELEAEIERLKSEIERESEAIAVKKKDLEKRLARTESDLELADRELGRPRSGELDSRIEQQRKVVKATEDVLEDFRKAQKELMDLRGQLYSILPEGARIHLANDLFEIDPEDPDRQEAFIRTVLGHSPDNIQDDIEAAKLKSTMTLLPRFGIGLQGIGSLITIMVPGSGKYSIVVTGLQLGIGAVVDYIIDPTSFLDRHALKEISGATAELKTAIARLNLLGGEVDKAARDLDRLIKEGGSRRKIDAIDAKLVRLIKDMIREVDNVQQLTNSQVDKLERFLQAKKAELEDPETEQRDRRERRREVEDAIEYLTEERDELKAELEQLQTDAQAKIDGLKAELAGAEQRFDENCRDR